MIRYLRTIILCALFIPLGLSAYTTDTLTYTVEAQRPRHYREHWEKRPTQHIDENGDTVFKRVKITDIVYYDTVYTVLTTRDTLLVPDNTSINDTVYDHNGSQFHFYIGGGYGSLGYNIGNLGKVSGAPAALLQVQYAYFFDNNWGMALGVSFSNISSMVKLTGNRQWYGVSDSDGELYNHTTLIYDWKERETVHRLSVPISLQYQTYFGEKDGPKEKYKSGLYWDLGASVDLNLYNRYNVLLGDIEDKAYYPATHLSLENLHEFHRRDIAGKGKMDASLVGVTVFADFGFLFPMSPRADFAFGFFGQYGALDINRSERNTLGFASPDFPFMQPYRSAFTLNEATKARPWEAGIKLGVRVHARKVKINTYENFDFREQYVEQRDTASAVITRTIKIEDSKLPKGTDDNLVPNLIRQALIPDTIEQEQPEIIVGNVIESAGTKSDTKSSETSGSSKVSEVSKSSKSKKSDFTASTSAKKTTERSQESYGHHHAKRYDYHLIYFALDKYSLNTEAKAHLDRIVKTMLNNPNRHVVISGHACELGSAEYNMKLSRNRALAVADYLEEHGIDRQRIVMHYYGNQVPSTKESHNLSKDRRVIVKISK